MQSENPEIAWLRASLRESRYTIELAAIFAINMAALVAASAQTVGPSVVAGQAQILSAGDTTVVTQSTSKAIINWQSFSVASGSTLQFVQRHLAEGIAAMRSAYFRQP